MEKFTPVLREYQDRDFPAIQQIWSDTGMGGKVRGDGPESIRATLRHGGKLLVLAEPISNRPIGTSWLTHDGRRVYLHHFGISPAYQGFGFSKPLLDASLEYARSTGLQVKLEVHASNAVGRKLYEKAGFQYLGDYLVYIIRDYQNPSTV